MNNHPVFPGGQQHQAILRAIVDYYQDDPRVQAGIVFGSLGRGNWDPASDIDLDVILNEGEIPGLAPELRAMCAALEPLGERAALVLPDTEDEGDVILESLMGISVRYHTLETTSAHILESMRILCGSLGRDAITAAGEANREEDIRPAARLLDEFLCNAAWAQAYLRRGFIWLGLDLLDRMRSLLIELFASSRGSFRKFRFFQAEAEADLQRRLGETIPAADLASAQSSLGLLLDLMEEELGCLSNGTLRLNESQKTVLGNLRSC